MQRFFGWLAAVVVLVAGLFVIPSAAYAADSCDTRVIDQTKSKVLDAGTIGKKIATLEGPAVAADVRVRAYQTAPGGSLDDNYLAKLVAACPAWQGLDGKAKGNLIVYLFSMDHKSYVFTGPNFHEKMKGQIDPVRGTMNAGFKRGDFTGGITAAMDKTYTVLAPSTTTVPATEPPVVTEPVDTSGASSSGFGQVVLIVVLAFLAGMALYFGGKFILGRGRAKKDRERQRLAAHQVAIRSRDAAYKAIEPLLSQENVDMLQRDVEILLTKLQDPYRAELRKLWSKAEESVRAAVTTAGGMTDESSDKDFGDTESLEWYEEVANGYKLVQRQAREAQESLDKVDEVCTKMNQKITEAPQRATQLKADVEAFEAQLQAAQQQGYSFAEFDGPVSELTSLVSQAMTLTETKRPVEALDELAKGEKTLTDLKRRLNKTLQVHQTLTSAYESSSRMAAADYERLTEAAQSLDRIVADYGKVGAAELSSRRELDKLSRGIQSALQGAKQALDDKTQGWEAAARQYLRGAEKYREDATPRCEAISKALVELDDFSRDGVHYLDRFEEDIAVADRKLQGFRGSNVKRRQTLEAMRVQLVSLRAEMDSRKPGYASVLKEFTQLQDELRKLLAAAASDHGRLVNQAKKTATRRRRTTTPSQGGYGSTGYNSGYGSNYGGSSYNDGVIAGTAYGSTYGSDSGSSNSSYDSGSSSSSTDYGSSSGDSSGGSWDSGSSSGDSSGGSW